MLTQTLRDLERDGLKTRHVFPTKPPSVEYRLSGLGTSSLSSLAALVTWAMDRHAAIRAARKRYDEALVAKRHLFFEPSAIPPVAEVWTRTAIYDISKATFDKFFKRTRDD